MKAELNSCEREHKEHKNLKYFHFLKRKLMPSVNILASLVKLLINYKTPMRQIINL